MNIIERIRNYKSIQLMKLDLLKSRFTDESIYQAMETDLGDYIESLEEITSEIPIVDKSIKPIITCLKNSIKIYIKVSGAEDKALLKEELDYLTSCFVQNVDAFKEGIMPVLQIVYDEMLLNLLIDVIDVESIYETKVNLIDFYKDPVGSSINTKISQEVVSVFCAIMREYNQKFLFDVWNNTILNTAETLLNDEFFMCRDKIRNYVVFSESSEAKKMHALRIKHHKEIMALEEQKVFEEENATVKNLYCPIDVKIHYEVNEPNPIEIFKGIREINCRKERIQEDFIALFEWVIDKCNIAILSGEPGYGKTTILINFVARLSQIGYLVFYMKFRDIEIHNDSDIFIDIIETLKKYEYFKYLYNESGDKYIKNIKELDEAIFIFDGVDEVVSSKLDTTLQLILDTLLGDFGKRNKIIISGRKKLINLFSNEFNRFRCIDILTLKNSHNDRREYIWENLCSVLNLSMPFSKLFGFIEESILEIPLLLFLLAWVMKYENSNTYTIENRAALYELIIQTVYRKSYDKQSEVDFDSNSYTDYKKCLQIIGTTCFLKKSNEVSFTESLDYAKYIGFDSQFSYWIRNIEGDVNKLLLNFYFKEGKNGFYFYHKTFYEFLFSQEIFENILNLNHQVDYFTLFGLVSCKKSELNVINILIEESFSLLNEDDKYLFKFSIEKLLKEILLCNYMTLDTCLLSPNIEPFIGDKFLKYYSYVTSSKRVEQAISKEFQLSFDDNIWRFWQTILFESQNFANVHSSIKKEDVLDGTKLSINDKEIHFFSFEDIELIELINVTLFKCEVYSSEVNLFYTNEMNERYVISFCLFQNTTLNLFVTNGYIYYNEFRNSKINFSLLGVLNMRDCTFLNCDVTNLIANNINGTIHIKDIGVYFDNCYINDGLQRIYFSGNFSDFEFVHGFLKDNIIQFNEKRMSKYKK